MRLEEVLKSLKKGERYDLVKLWKEMPVKLGGILSFISINERLVSVRVKESKFVSLFTGVGEIYLKASEHYYLRCKSLKVQDYDVYLSVEDYQEAPPFIFRRHVRVVPLEREDIKVHVNLQEGKIEAYVVDISEGGMGIVVDGERAPTLLKEMERSNKLPLSMELTGETILELYGEIRNVNLLEEGSIRLGLQFIEAPSSVLEPIRQYVMRVQRHRLGGLSI
ncbi:MAG: PilZ domain-containing protein [Acidobacteria bacterium]|nr:MAG: PilZ domain-containing protein [Acidobacteriota bacterium]